jgi:type IV pilus assembly protein PilC
VPAVQAMEIVAETSGNILVTDAVLKAREQMMAGSNIAEPLGRSGAFPMLVVRMIEVGEETGQLELMLIKVAEFFENEVDMAIKALSSLIEPLMIVIVGSMVGVIIIAIYLPMFSIYDKIGIVIPFLPWYLNLIQRKLLEIKTNINTIRQLFDADSIKKLNV